MVLMDEIEFRPMEPDDVPEVMAIENSSFPTPWSEDIFTGDLLENPNSKYIVGIIDSRVASYAGIWILNEVGHITTIAVRRDLLRCGLGEITLEELLEIGRKSGVEKFTLEVRESNEEALGLYEKYGFKRIGRRKNYYKEIGEDAIVMFAGDPHCEG
jgi:ribosomal-protein-alanine N-acetyltransferase